LNGTSGLLALYWFGHFGDFVGVLASCPKRELVEHLDRLMVMLRTMEATRYASPFDVFLEHLEFEDDERVSPRWIRERAESAEGDDATKLRRYDYDVVASKINDRAVGLRAWSLPDSLRLTRHLGALRWFGTLKTKTLRKPGEPAMVDAQRSAARMRMKNPLEEEYEPIRYAYAVAKSNASSNERLFVTIDFISQWLFWLLSGPRPMGPVEVEEWVKIISDPDSRTAQTLRVALNSYSLLGPNSNEVMQAYLDALVAKPESP
jgi:hypothetical protein